jgi:hypothetical protein
MGGDVAGSQKKMINDTTDWRVLESLMVMKNRWISLIGERLLDNKGNQLDYWRVERCDSVIILPIHQNVFILPKSEYRPGVGMRTHDFPGGRHEKCREPLQSAHLILERELGIVSADIQTISLINDKPWFVDSSFSSQKLHVFEAILKDEALIDPGRVDICCPVNQTESLLNMLVCMQCRCALLEWKQHNNQSKGM